jgi:hypothetical protein
MLLILIVILPIIGSVEATTFKVCSNGCDYSSIQNAIKHADPGDTINVSRELIKKIL